MCIRDSFWNFDTYTPPKEIMLLEYVVGFLWIVYIWETYLDIRQHRKLKYEDQIPVELKDVISDEKFKKSKSYNLDKSRYDFVYSFYSQVESTLVLWFGGIPFLWDWSTRRAIELGFTEDHEIIISIIFVLSGSIFEGTLSIPWELYSHFVIEERHGFNKLTMRTYISDKIKSILLLMVIGTPTIAALIHIIRWGGPHFYIYAFIFITCFTLLMVTIYPTFIAPLFNTFTPLQEGELRTEIERLAKKLEFPLTQLYVIDGSTRSSHSNAYFYGFFKNKRIVLYDTLLNQASNDEVVAVLGHEFGHWKLNHITKNLILGLTQLFISFFTFGQFINWDYMYHSFGFQTQPIIIGMIIFFEFLMSPIDHILSFLQNLLSRHYEYQADNFAKQLGLSKSLKSGLIKLVGENLSDFKPDHWYSTYHNSHPTLLERMNALGKTD
eukprot:TRINITY_DN267_c0_g2_i2.p1 TRINITY_DN267_c0_g2~~TRINITY_DN267_c0_g2_i2.p1  ORF type:complete len:438 (+),score=63.37 TRINITY_DN267_c0_g2_i2:64-1377(+)